MAGPDDSIILVIAGVIVAASVAGAAAFFYKAAPRQPIKEDMEKGDMIEVGNKKG
ncbi:hypothetical protein HDV00_007142 [Rhizophlyctis rosea]|nr:hypothetical protein HDV00_007142 [Rhizophlyctis rosea]